MVSTVGRTRSDGGAVKVTWSRTDQVALEGVLWALPLAAGAAVVARVVDAVQGDPLEVTGSLPDDLVVASEPVSGSLASGSLAGTVVVQDATAAQHGWALVPMVVLLVLAVVVARLLLGVVRSLRTGDPFTTANARRLATLGTVIVFGGVLLPLVQAVAVQAVLEPLLLDAPPSWELDLHLWPALAGVLVGFLAEVFSRGARLREDVEGLV